MKLLLLLSLLLATFNSNAIFFEPKPLVDLTDMMKFAEDNGGVKIICSNQNVRAEMKMILNVDLLNGPTYEIRHSSGLVESGEIHDLNADEFNSLVFINQKAADGEAWRMALYQDELKKAVTGSYVTAGISPTYEIGKCFFSMLDDENGFE